MCYFYILNKCYKLFSWMYLCKPSCGCLGRTCSFLSLNLTARMKAYFFVPGIFLAFIFKRVQLDTDLIVDHMELYIIIYILLKPHLHPDIHLQALKTGLSLRNHCRTELQVSSHGVMASDEPGGDTLHNYIDFIDIWSATS